MAILWADSFEHYGLGDVSLTNLKQGAYTVVDAGSAGKQEVLDTYARTGTRSLKLDGGTTGSQHIEMRKSFNSSSNTIGVGFGMYFLTLPSNPTVSGFTLASSAYVFGSGITSHPGWLISATVNTDGSFTISKNRINANDYEILGLTDPVITPAAFHHIEIKFTVSDTVGYFEMRVNGNPVIVLEDMNFGVEPCTQFCFGKRQQGGGGSANDWYMDDLVIWDGSGAVNNDFLGPVRVSTLFPNADTAQADWSKNGAGTGYGCINENTPDGDTTYISGLAEDDASEFGFEDTPDEAALIKAVFVPIMARAAAAGTSKIQVGIVSGGNAAVGPETQLTPVYTYWPSGSFDVDPNTGGAWSKAAVDAALIRVEKTE